MFDSSNIFTTFVMSSGSKKDMKTKDKLLLEYQRKHPTAVIKGVLKSKRESLRFGLFAPEQQPEMFK